MIYNPVKSVPVIWMSHDLIPHTLVHTLLRVWEKMSHDLIPHTLVHTLLRVWEKIAESMQAVARNTRGLKAKIASWAKGVGLKGNYRRQMGYAS